MCLYLTIASVLSLLMTTLSYENKDFDYHFMSWIKSELSQRSQ